MSREGEGRGGCGTLYVVATPIGNLEDITFRGLKVLKTVAIIAAENVSHTKNLCRHYGITTRLTRYNQHNRGSRGPELVRSLKGGLDVALVTDAGTPGISDPGIFLIKLAVEADVKVSPVPGPSAVVAALSVAGLPTDQFSFVGFLSNRAGKRKKELRGLAGEARTLVFYEAPHRLKAMLADLEEVFGERQVVMVREMTKVFEEVRRGTAGEILDQLSGAVKGEITLVVAGKERVSEDKRQPLPELEKRIDELLREGKLSIRDIASRLSREEGSPYRQIYKECLARKNLIDG